MIAIRETLLGTQPDAQEHAPWKGPRSSSDVDGRDRSGQLIRTAERWVVEHPALFISAAVAAGVVLGWLIKRR